MRSGSTCQRAQPQQAAPMWTRPPARRLPTHPPALPPALPVRPPTHLDAAGVAGQEFEEGLEVQALPPRQHRGDVGSRHIATLQTAHQLICGATQQVGRAGGPAGGSCSGVRYACVGRLQLGGGLLQQRNCNTYTQHTASPQPPSENLQRPCMPCLLRYDRHRRHQTC